jgi:large subunit ribosomal protein L9
MGGADEPGKYFVDTPSRLRNFVGFPLSLPPTNLTTMAHSEVLLIKPVEGLGGEGDQVKVRAGYARNYLLPRNVAVPVTTANRKQVEALKKRRGEREATELNGAQELARKLEKTALAFAATTGEGGKMFGSVTSADLHDKLVAAGFTIDRKRILLHTPVKTLGKHTVKVKLHADVTVELPFDVVSENPIEPSAEEKAAEEQKNRKVEVRR